jgi:hypothetical protein
VLRSSIAKWMSQRTIRPSYANVFMKNCIALMVPDANLSIKLIKLRLSKSKIQGFLRPLQSKLTNPNFKISMLHSQDFVAKKLRLQKMQILYKRQLTKMNHSMKLF